MHQTGLLTIDALAELWSIPKATLYNWVNQGRLPYLKIGRCLRFDPAEIERIEDRSRMGTANRR
jgi:excisionase family DNA binding protein